MADKDKLTDAEIAEAFARRDTKAADKASADAIAKARKDQEAIDQAIVDAIYDRTHDKNGNPIPLVGN